MTQFAQLYHRRFLFCAAAIALTALGASGETPEAPKPPAEGPLSNSPPPGIALPNTKIKGVPLTGVPDSAIPFGTAPATEGNESEAAQTLVVFNTNDPDSGDLAHFYAEKRGIPKNQVIGLACSRAEEIGRAEYDLFIARPLIKIFEDNHWWEAHEGEDEGIKMVMSNHIRFVALMRGMPLKIIAAPNYPGDKPFGPPALSAHNESSVDSELAVLGVEGHPVSGLLPNPYFRTFSRIGDAKQPAMMLVCRLDAPTPEIVRRMITDSIAAEKNGLHGFAYVDARGVTDPGYVEGDQWLFALASNARRRGIPVVLDQGPGLFPDAYPMRHAAFYFGWYAENVSGPFLRPDFRFEPGAVAVHIHSFSAASLRDPHKNWCAPLLAAGAAATLGNVYEPFLDFTPHLDIFFDRLLSGFNFAESSYMSERALSWMTTCIGDPLYRPFPALAIEKKGNHDEWTAYHDGAVEWFKDRAAGATALKNSARTLHSGVISEGLGLLELTANGRAEALAAFDEARKAYKNPDDEVRVAVHEIGLLESMSRGPEALALAKKEIEAHPKLPGAEILRMLEPKASGGGGSH